MSSVRKGRLGPWNVGRVLGTGETSSVHLCTHADDPTRTAAVKILGRHDPEGIARFRVEADVLASLSHPNIVRVLGLDLEDELPYLAMEHVPGQALSERLLDGPLPIGEALGVVRQVLEALAYLHARNVAHRDVRPSNMILHEGRVVLVDFGLARASERPSPQSLHGARFGAVTYAPPEWIGPAGVHGVPWDLYALGVVLYELVTGQTPFTTPNTPSEHLRAAKVMQLKRETPGLDPGPTYPDALRSLILDLTHRDPASRPRSATAALARLDAIPVPHAQPKPPPVPRAPLTPRFHVTSFAWTGVVGLTVLGVVAMILALLARAAGQI